MMKLRLRSIRAQLLLWLLIPVVSLGILSCITTFFIAIDYANDAYDEALADSGRALASRLYFLRNRLSIDLPEAAKAILEYDNSDKFFYQVLSPKGRLIAGDRLFDATSIPTEKLSFWDSMVKGIKVRVATLVVPVRPGFPEELATIHVAETYATRDKLRTEILSNVVLIQLLFILLSAGSVWLGISQGLIPLEKIRQAIERRSPKDLSPIEETAIPVEISPLARAINDLMQRLQEEFSVQRRFVANAAHQLRTPIAGLKTQAEVAIRSDNLEDTNHALNQMQIAIERTVHLANQLLSLAQVEEPAIADYSQPIDLVQLVKSVTREFVPQALKKNMDIGYEGLEEVVEVQGNPMNLRELISNLLDNAMKYCQTGDRVTVGVDVQAKHILLNVEDNGPGIPAEYQDLVFERFYRILGSNAAGSGLGLAIVKEIAQAHGASIQLTAGSGGKGTLIAITFPLHRV